VNHLGLNDRVEFRGRLCREALRDAYRQADVLVLPSTNAAEAFGLVAAEAQACGVPVIASRLPGVRRVVLHEKTGLLVEPGSAVDLAQAIDALLTDRSRRARLGLEARLHALRQYRFDVHIDHLLEIYTRCLRA
jgi:glycosyltransferase involved in cell wall biosynthesis